MEQFISLFADLESALKSVDEKKQTTMEKAEQSIRVCHKYLKRLKSLVTAKGFANEADEIYFFKHQKPLLVSKLLYNVYLMKLESALGFHDNQSLLRFYRLRLKKLARFGKKSRKFIYYYRSGSTHLDDKLFKRSTIELRYLSNPELLHLDPAFSASHDSKLAKLLAKEKLARYISDQIENILHPNAGEKGKATWKSPLTWTGPKVAFVELSYGLFLTKQVNHGNMRIGEFQKALQMCFNVEVDEPARKYTEIRDRKINPTKYLDQMAFAVQAKVKSDQEKAANNDG